MYTDGRGDSAEVALGGLIAIEEFAADLLGDVGRIGVDHGHAQHLWPRGQSAVEMHHHAHEESVSSPHPVEGNDSSLEVELEDGLDV